MRMRVSHVAAVHHDQASRPGKYRLSYTKGTTVLSIGFPTQRVLHRVRKPPRRLSHFFKTVFYCFIYKKDTCTERRTVLCTLYNNKNHIIKKCEKVTRLEDIFPNCSDFRKRKNNSHKGTSKLLQQARKDDLFSYSHEIMYIRHCLLSLR